MDRHIYIYKCLEVIYNASMRWVLDAACSFFLGVQVEMQKKRRKIPDSFHQVGSKRTHPDTQARAHTHTRVSRERRGSTRGSHCTNYIYIYMHIVRHVPSLLPSLVWCYTWQLSSLRTLSISRVTYIYIYIYAPCFICIIGCLPAFSK